MRFGAYIKDKALLLLFHVVCMVLLAAFLRMTGYGRDCSLLILLIWGLILAVYLFGSYWERRRHFCKIDGILGQVEQPYLLGELMPKAFGLEDRLYQELIRVSNKSVIEKIRQLEEQQKAYREYIECWVHEVKAPITGIASICENYRKCGGSADGADMEVQKAFTDILQESCRIENDVEMVLYYARSEAVYKDYFIARTPLAEAVYEALSKNRLLLIQNQARAQVACPDFAYTDRKWLVFILNQLLWNSVKYRKEHLFINIYTKAGDGCVRLVVEDNGLGILAQELPRIFDKGFTGSNGRRVGSSTGMGLYLCRKLCERLGVPIYAESEHGSGTKMILEFPVGDLTSGVSCCDKT